MLVAEYVVESTILHGTLTRFPDITLRHEAQYRTADDTIRLFFWMSGVDSETFETAIDDDPTVTNRRQLDAFESRYFYRVDFTPAGYRKSTMPMWSEDDVVLLEASGTHDGWRFRMRFPDRTTLTEYREAYVDRGCSFSLLSLQQGRPVDGDLESSLSPAQREALLTAYESGYFDIPRGITQRELSRKLNISSQSVSERLRRAISAMIESTLRRK